MERRKLSFRTLDEVLADVDRLHQAGYQRLGNWSLGQMCHHLQGLMIASVKGGFPVKAPWIFRKTVGRYWIGKILKAERMKSGFKLPKKLLPPEHVDETAAVADFHRAVQLFADHKGEYVEHPLFGHLTREEATKLQLIHCAHHLSFLIPSAEIAAARAS